MVDRFGFDTLDLSKTLLLWVSGGRDSTAMTLALYEYLEATQKKAKVLLLTTYTYYNKLENLEVVDRLSEYTGFRKQRILYQGKIRPGKIINISFKTIPRALEARFFEQCGSVKKHFLCCKVLKHKPGKAFLKNIPVGSVINFLGFTHADKAQHRRYRLNELRNSETWYRDHSEFYHHKYFYPLRDIDKPELDAILDRHGFGDIPSSGCRICPLFVVFDWSKKDPQSDVLSKQVANKLGIVARAELQTGLDEFY